MKIKIIGSIFILFFLGSCTPLSSYKEQDDYLRCWRLDTLPCKKLRTIEHADYIWNSINWKNKNEEFVINRLGKSDTVTFKTFTINKGLPKNAKVLTYYYDTPVCNGMLDTLDCCWIEINIVSNKVKLVEGGCR